MPKKEMYDNIPRVIKVNSGQLDPAGGTMTEILDLQISKGYVARIRKVIFYIRYEEEQVPVLDSLDVAERMEGFLMALVNDPDDEYSVAIPTHEIDHDVICDYEVYTSKLLADQGANLSGGWAIHAPRCVHEFSEDLDVIAPRNIRFNAMGNIIGATTKPQALVEVYFTYEKVTSDVIMELLNIA